MSYIDSEDYANELMKESDEEFEKFLKFCPKCPYCGELITEERGFWDDSLGLWWHENCVYDYIKEKNTDEYIADTIIELVKDKIPVEEIKDY